MLLAKKAEKILQDIDENNLYSKKKNILNAERLADMFHDVEQQAFSIDIDRFAGLPASRVAAKIGQI